MTAHELGHVLNDIRRIVHATDERIEKMQLTLTGLTDAVTRLQAEVAADVAAHNGPNQQQPTIDALAADVGAAADQLHAANAPPAP